MNSDLESRIARALGKTLSERSLPSQKPDPHVIFPAWCAATGKPFHAVAEQRGSTLFLKGNVTPAEAEGADNGNVTALAKLGEFDFDDAGWPGCPHCGTKYNDRKQLYLLWACSGGSCGGHLHCTGERGGMFRCACGRVGDFNFTPVDAFEVRGAAGAAPSVALPGRSGTASLPPPNARLPFRRK